MTLNNIAFLKQHPDIPDFYSFTIHYINGQKETFEVATHFVVDKIVVPNEGNNFGWEAFPMPYLKFVTKNDVWNWIPLQGILKVEFDANYSKLIAIQERLQREKAEKEEKDKKEGVVNA